MKIFEKLLGYITKWEWKREISYGVTDEMFLFQNKRNKKTQTDSNSVQIGRGVCKPVTVEVSDGSWHSPGGPQSFNPPWEESRWMRRWAMAKPPLPSNWVKTSSTCLELDRIERGWKTNNIVWWWWCYRWSGGIASTLSKAPRVDTTLNDSWQSQRTCNHLSAWRFSTVTTRPACQSIRKIQSIQNL